MFLESSGVVVDLSFGVDLRRRRKVKRKRRIETEALTAARERREERMEDRIFFDLILQRRDFD